jgi:MFS family permease
MPTRRWAIAWTLAVTELISWGILYYAFSALLVPIQEETGWSSGAITGAYSLSMLVSGLAAPLIGRWLDAHGPRGLMTGGSVLGVLLVIAWSRVETLPGFYLVWVGIGLASAATLYEPAFTTIAQWFRHDRSRAMLLVTILGGFASTLFLPLTGWLEARSDWRQALLILAGILAVGTVLPHALVLRSGPANQGAPAAKVGGTAKAPTFSALLRDPVFVRMTVAFFLQTTVSVAIAVHIIAYLIERGDDATFAAWAAGLIGAAQVAARVFTTLFERRLSIVSLTTAMFACQVLAIVLLVAWESAIGVIFSVVLLGMGRGAITLLRPSLVLDFYDVSRFGAVNGLQAMIVTIGRAIAPVITGIAAGISGYDPVFWGYAVLSLVSAWVLLPLRHAGPAAGV